MSIRESLPETTSRDRSFTEVFSRALRGLPCLVVGLGAVPELLPVHAWNKDADEADQALLAHCRGRTIDVGCGPGRLTAALVERGHFALGIDVVGEAVGQTLQRGVNALHLDVFDQVPGEGQWGSVLLADGNVGIGGDPAALLDRARQLLAPGGRVVVEIEPPGVPESSQWVTLECEGHRSRPFRWSVLGVDDLDSPAAAAGLSVDVVTTIGNGRWVAVLTAAA